MDERVTKNRKHHPQTSPLLGKANAVPMIASNAIKIPPWEPSRKTPYSRRVHAQCFQLHES